MVESEEKIKNLIGELEEKIDAQIYLMSGDVQVETRTRRSGYVGGIRFTLDKIYEAFPDYKEKKS